MEADNLMLSVSVQITRMALDLPKRKVDVDDSMYWALMQSKCTYANDQIRNVIPIFFISGK